MNLRIFLLFVVFASLGQMAAAQLQLIPTPQKVETKNTFFQFDKNVSFVRNDLDAFYTNELKDCVKQELNLNILTSKKSKKGFIKFLKISSSAKLNSALKKLELDSGFDFGTEGYILKITPEAIRIISKTDAGIFYGVQTLKQLIIANKVDNKISCLTIYDAPDFPVRAWQDDISRGPIPAMDLLKEQIQKMASFKLNYFTLYTEHVFKLEKHPGIAPYDGITKEEIKALAAFAKKYHVKLIGNYQSFGHMEETLKHPDYAHLAENNHIISPALEESYSFLQDVYEEIVPLYDGQFFNINCDETFGLGEGKSKAMVDSLGLEGVYLYHINRLNDLLKPYEKSILMWGDIASHHPKIVSQLPKNITVMAWGYHAAENFESSITPITDTGLDFWVAPGVSCWRNIYPHMQVAEVNIFNFIRDGYKNKASGVLNTSWDDDGLNFFENTWHGFVWGAENSWKAPLINVTPQASEIERKTRYEDMNRSFDAIFYGLKDLKSLTAQTLKFSNLREADIRGVLNNGRFFEPVFPIHYDYVKAGKRAEHIAALEKLEAIKQAVSGLEPDIRFNKKSLDYLQFAIEQVQFTLQKNMLRIDVHQFLNGDKNITETHLKKSIETLKKDARTLKLEYEALWNLEYRNSWLSVNMEKFDNLINDLDGLYGYCIITAQNTVSEMGRQVSIKPIFENMPVYYTLDEEEVSTRSKKYTTPFYIDRDAKIIAKVIQNEKNYPAARDSFIYHLGIGKLEKLNSEVSEYHPSYDGGGDMALLDGKLGNPADLRTGRWQGFSGEDIDVEIDLGRNKPIHNFTMGFYQNTFSWVILPKKIDIYYKNNKGEDYQLLKTIPNTISPKEEGTFKHNFEASFKAFNTRYLKIVATYYGKLPEWHRAGSQYESMLFSDEIILK
jgi:hypothetical protein